MRTSGVSWMYTVNCVYFLYRNQVDFHRVIFRKYVQHTHTSGNEHWTLNSVYRMYFKFILFHFAWLRFDSFGSSLPYTSPTHVWLLRNRFFFALPIQMWLYASYITCRYVCFCGVWFGGDHTPYNCTHMPRKKPMGVRDFFDTQKIIRNLFLIVIVLRRRRCHRHALKW